LFAGMVALCAMLLLFQRVVQQQASDGELRRSAMSALSVETARCDRMPGTAERAACRAALVPVPRVNASLSHGVPGQP
jgi:hypothetical protein